MRAGTSPTCSRRSPGSRRCASFVHRCRTSTRSRASPINCNTRSLSAVEAKASPANPESYRASSGRTRAQYATGRRVTASATGRLASTRSCSGGAAPFDAPLHDLPGLDRPPPVPAVTPEVSRAPSTVGPGPRGWPPPTISESEDHGEGMLGRLGAKPRWRVDSRRRPCSSPAQTLVRGGLRR